MVAGALKDKINVSVKNRFFNVGRPAHLVPENLISKATTRIQLNGKWGGSWSP